MKCILNVHERDIERLHLLSYSDLAKEVTSKVRSKINEIVSKGHQFALIEGTWSGYRPEQRRVDRRYIMRISKKNRDKVIDVLRAMHMYQHEFNDGTTESFSTTLHYSKPKISVKIRRMDSLIDMIFNKVWEELHGEEK